MSIDPLCVRRIGLYFREAIGIIARWTTNLGKQFEMNLQSLVQDFVSKIVAAVESETADRMRARMIAALNGEASGRPGRPPKGRFFGAGSLSAGPSRRRPKQFCPVPGCKNVAAPVFGMVCSEHKNVPRDKIKKYREARRKAKALGKAA
jgi:hypothetical protein